MADAPEILGEQTFVEKDDGIQMELVCIVHGSPVPEIVWFRDGARVIPDNRIRAGRIGRKHLLTVDRITAEADAGTYVCKASNDKGQSMQSFRVLGEKICSILSDYISQIRNPTYRGTLDKMHRYHAMLLCCVYSAQFQKALLKKRMYFERI